MIKEKSIWLATISGIFLITQYSSLPAHLIAFKNGYTSSSNSIPASTKDLVHTSLEYEERDLNCSSYSVRFGKHLKTTYLVSYPRSGNTWLRYLIEGATGFFTSSVYGDKRLLQYDFLGEIEPPGSGRTIVIKTHEMDVPYTGHSAEESVILLLRNPLKSIISFWNFKGGRKNNRVSFFDSVNNSTYETKKFHNYVLKSLKDWKRLNTKYLHKSRNILIVLYEELKSHTRSELLKILQFLQQPVDEGRLGCLLKHSEGPFKRNHTGEEFDPFSKVSSVEKTMIGDGFRSILRLAEARGYVATSEELKKIMIDDPIV